MSYQRFTQQKRFNERSAGRIPHNYVRIGSETFDSQAEADRYMIMNALAYYIAIV